jgi:hypothetical protein
MAISTPTPKRPWGSLQSPLTQERRNMTEEQEKDLEWLHEIHRSLLEKKYRDGAEKHGGDLLKMTTRQALDEAIEENLDQYVYLMKAVYSLEKENRERLES